MTAALDAPRRPPILWPVLFGAGMGLLFFGLFGAWAGLALLDSAAVAPGEIVVDSNRKTIQHLEGGIIGRILVREGDSVAAGQVLVRLDGTQAEAALQMYRGQMNALRALEARLLAERDGAPEIAFPPDLDPADANLRPIMDGQRRIFEARRTTLAGQIGVLDQKVAQLKAQIEGAEARGAATRRQAELIAAEIADTQVLFDKGLTPKPRLLALQRAAADLKGQLGMIAGSIAEAEQGIGEARLKMIDLQNSRADQVVADLRDSQMQIADLGEKLKTARDIEARRDVVAPVAGVVVNMRYFTPGGVIQPGSPILDIVPQHDPLMVAARVKPGDIDVVHPGLPAKLRLTAFSQRTTPVVDGVLTQVSADRLTDQRTGEPYYDARVRIDRKELADLPQVQLYPGMPAEVLIVTGRRTLVDYIAKPLRDSFARAFRE